MPLYAFQCEKCGHKFEELVSIDKKDSIVCRQCGGTVKRVYEGKCAFGSSSGGGGCSGNCGGCAGCGHHE